MKIRKILAGIDFEKDTERVLAYASLFAGTYNASLTLLYVIDYLMTPPSYLAPYIEEEERIAGRKLKELKKELTDYRLKAETEVIVGRLQESFDAAAKKAGADMLILGFATHPFRRSSSEKVIKGLQMPVLVVRGGMMESALIGSVKIRKILCPVDFSDISRKALDAAKELADKFSAELDILHIFPDRIMERLKPSDKDKAAKELYSNAKEMLEKFLNASGLTMTGVIEKGNVDEEIVSFAKRREIDLIVMGARGLGLIEGMLLGSVTDAVLKTSPCPVLVIR